MINTKAIRKRDVLTPCRRCTRALKAISYYRGDAVCITCRSIERWRKEADQFGRRIERLLEMKADREQWIQAAKGAAR